MGAAESPLQNCSICIISCPQDNSPLTGPFQRNQGQVVCILGSRHRRLQPWLHAWLMPLPLMVIALIPPNCSPRGRKSSSLKQTYLVVRHFLALWCDASRRCRREREKFRDETTCAQLLCKWFLPSNIMWFLVHQLITNVTTWLTD